MAVCCSRDIATGFSWLYPCSPISWPLSATIRHCSGNLGIGFHRQHIDWFEIWSYAHVSKLWPGMKNVVLMLYLSNSLKRRSTPIVPANKPRDLSSISFNTSSALGIDMLTYLKYYLALHNCLTNQQLRLRRRRCNTTLLLKTLKAVSNAGLFPLTLLSHNWLGFLRQCQF